MNVHYNLTDSFSTSLNYIQVPLGNICDKEIIVNGCTDDQFGDQFMEIDDQLGNRLVDNDDIYSWRICSRIKPSQPVSRACNNATLKLGCFGSSNCGGTVEIAMGDPCPAGTYSKNGLTPCLPCPLGLNSTIGNQQCTRCGDGYIGFNGTSPCVRCPAGTIEVGHTTCEICNSQTLHSMPADLHGKCFRQLLNNIAVLEQKIDMIVGTFEQYLVDTKYGMPTVHPTARPTHRRRSRAPTAAGSDGM
jgi:hypothetical protein